MSDPATAGMLAVLFKIKPVRRPALPGKNKEIFLTMKGMKDMKRKPWSADERGDGRVHPLTKALPLCPPCG